MKLWSCSIFAIPENKEYLRIDTKTWIVDGQSKGIFYHTCRGARKFHYAQTARNTGIIRPVSSRGAGGNRPKSDEANSNGGNWRFKWKRHSEWESGKLKAWSGKERIKDENGRNYASHIRHYAMLIAHTFWYSHLCVNGRPFLAVI